MACVQVQCLVPPCPQWCDEPAAIGPYVNQTLPSSSIDARLLMNAPTLYTGGQYPTTPGNTEPDFRIETDSLDWWRLVLLALGIVIGAVVIKRL